MKVSFFLFGLLVGLALATEQEDAYSKYDSLLDKNGKITKEYIKALANEMTASEKESVKTLGASQRRYADDDDNDDYERPIRHDNAFYSKKSSDENRIYDIQQDKFRRIFDYVNKRFKTNYDEFEEVAKDTDVPADFCPTANDPTPCTEKDRKYRQLNGWCNNPKWPEGGAAGTVYGRLLPPNYEKYCNEPRTKGKSGYELPNPRDVALKLFRHHESDSTLTQMFLFFGQFLDHDIVMSPESSNYDGSSPKCPCGTTDKKCININVPEYDKFFKNKQCLSVIRNAAAVSKSRGCKFSCREQLTETTHAFDLSSLYGWFQKTGDSLRAWKWGMMKWSEYGHSILPYFANYSNHRDGCKYNKPHTLCMASGDPRSEDNAFLITIQTLFWYEHNRIAKELYKLSPYCSDETLYQEAKRILIGLFQKIVYNDWLPIALGDKIVKKYDLAPGKKGEYFYGYDDSKFPTVYNEFGLAMRFGHIMIKQKVYAADEYCNPTKRYYINDILFCHNWIIGSIDSIARGLVCDNTYYKFDQMASDLTDHLFEDMFGYGGSSLSAINVARGRDHGTPFYQDMRRHFKLDTTDDFYKLFGIRSETQKKLKELYYSTDDIDFWVGIAVERSYRNYDPDGGILGETLSHFLGEQFRQLKVSDRFFWESGDKRSNPFTLEQLDHIRSVNIGSLLCQHINIKTIQEDPFRVAGPDNPLISCDKVEKIDVSKFKIRSCDRDRNYDRDRSYNRERNYDKEINYGRDY